jgi:hypothetical protein
MNPPPDFSPSKTDADANPPGIRESELQNTAIGITPKQSSAIRVGTFWLNGVEKHYAIMDGPDIHSQDCLTDVTKYWGLPNPAFLLETNTSNTHRDSIISVENAPIILNEIFKNDSNQITQEEGGDTTNTTRSNYSSPEGKEFDLDDAETGNIGAKKSPLGPYLEHNLAWMAKYKNGANVVKSDWLWINRYLQRRIIHSLSSIISACEMTNGWILCHGAPSANEKMLEAAMEMTGSSPTILVVDALDKYNDGTKEKLSQLVTNARPMHSDDYPDSKLEFDDMKDTYDIVNKRTSIINNSFEPGITLWKQDKSQNWKAAFPWSYGTHFIFSNSHEDFEPRLLGPSGFLCMHGNTSKSKADQKRTGFIIRDSIMTVKPCLLFDNSGVETQAYARLIRRIKERDREERDNYEKGKREEAAKPNKAKRLSVISAGKAKPGNKDAVATKGGRPESPLKKTMSLKQIMFKQAVQGETEKHKKPDYFSELQLTLRREAWELIEYANRGHTLEPKNALNLADVMQIVDMYCSNPRLFRKIVVPVDPLNDSPDEIVKVMTLSFARANSEAREVGAGDADKNSVEQAWHLHEQLERSKIIKTFQRNVLYFLYISSGFFTVLVAVLNQSYQETLTDDFTQWIAVALASAVSLCGGILYLINADAQVNQISNAQARIIDEIFRFRMVSHKRYKSHIS